MPVIVPAQTVASTAVVSVSRGSVITAAADAAPPSLSGISGGGAVELGQPVILTVSFYGTGDGQTYQWQKNGSAIAGATAISYSIAAATPSDAATYTVTVTNTAGSSVATTSLTVKPLAGPVITTHPSSLTRQVGQQAIFGFVATGSYPRTYQWRRNGADITGATDAAYTINSVTTSDAAGYSVVVSNSQGSATSNSASLTVNAATPVVLNTSYPYDTTATVGNQVSLYCSVYSGSSPFTYQWYKAGTAIAGETKSQLTFAAVTLSDAGKYSVLVSNIISSATSREAILTVNPPTPITITSQPQSATIYEGQSLYLGVSLNGTSPITYQWQKNGVAIAGATNGYYQINAVVAADAGDYAVVITNPAGSVTSNTAKIIVSPPIAPTITTQPKSQSVAYGGSLSLSVEVAGTTPLKFQWYKDGLPLSGATGSGYSDYSALPSDSGKYTVVVSNAAGSVTSSAADVVVAAAVLPTITTQPTPVQVSTGSYASFSVNYSSTGTGSLAFQWLKNGAPIAGATWSGYSISQVKASDAADYSVMITGVAGSVTSNVAKLTVLPPVAPSVSYWPYSTSAALGDNVYFSGPSVQGSPPFTYQWYKDGQAIAGATNASYSIARVTAADIGTYTLVISNDGGVISSPGIQLRLTTGTTTAPWVSAKQYGDIVYFLATTPSRIERYDLAGERWLPTVLLSDTQVPTAFAPTPDGVYIAYGRSLVRRALDLSGEAALLNAANPIIEMHAFDDWLYYLTSSGSYSPTYSMPSLRRSTLQAGPTVSTFTNMVFSTQARRGYGTSNSAGSSGGYSPSVVSIGADGSFTSVALPSGYYTLPNGARLFLLAGEQYVTTTGGTLYRTSDMSYAGALGQPFTDLVSLSTGATVVLRNGVLQALRAGDFVETGRASLGFDGQRMFVRNDGIFAFGPASGAGGAFAVSKLTSASFTPVSLPTVTNGAQERVSVDGVFYGDGVVHVLSRSKQAVLRWSTATRSYLSAIPLRGSPTIASQTPGSTRALFAYDDGTLTALTLSASATAETPISAVGNRVWGVTDLSDGLAMLNLYDYSDSGDFRAIFGAQGRAVFTSGMSYWGAGLGWNASLRRLYSAGRYSSDNAITYESVDANGAIRASTSNTVSGLIAPLRPNADGTLMVTGNGKVVNADLASVGVLANNITDGAWLSNQLYTITADGANTKLQRWSKSTYLQASSISVPGVPQRIFAVSGTQLVLVTTVQGYLSYTLINDDLSLASSPNPAAYTGVYMAKIGPSGAAGDLALYVRSDGTAVMLANLTGTHTGLLSTSTTINGDGSFIASVLDLASGTMRTIAGVINSDGTLTGSITTPSLTFSGSRTTGSVGSAGCYQAAAVNGGVGTAWLIVGADGRSVLVVQNATAVDGGAGTLDSSGGLSVKLSTGATLAVALDSGAGTFTTTADKDVFATTTYVGLRDSIQRTDRLLNISTRARIGGSAGTLNAGFVVSGAANRTVLIRAVGPYLSNFAIANPVGDPRLTLYQGLNKLAFSDDWSSEPNAGAIATVGASLNAFPLPSPGKDAALLVTLRPGVYTAEVSAPTGDNGVSLVEVYDAGDSPSGVLTRVVNLSSRGYVGQGEDALLAGIVVTGNVPKKILIRGIGPTLQLFSVSDALGDPVLTILSGQTVLATNDDWGVQSGGVSASDVAVAAVSAGAFGLPPSSKDAAILITLKPGLYTAKVTGKGTATGTALVEAYEVSK